RCPPCSPLFPSTTLFRSNVGWALAPVFMGVAGAALGWHGALLLAGAIGLVVVALLIVQGGDLRNEEKHEAAAPELGLSAKVKLLDRKSTRLNSSHVKISY